AAQLCDRLVILDHGRVLVEGSPQELIATHVGDAIVEITNPDQAVEGLLAHHLVNFDRLSNRLLIYGSLEPQLEQQLRLLTQGRQCTFRAASLEDVFLRLTGRELRE
ncbi:MAG: hypothetical protein PHI97_20390, partial [Desulfobulbus sp.]|nr:hypothetical protein [Desulfobulbus sp.]